MSAGHQDDRGVVYVATQLDKYVEEAFLSADSIKERNPDLLITLFTDRLSHPLCTTDRFDHVEPAAKVPDFRLETVVDHAPGWSEGQLSRLLCLRRTPYRQTLHLDADTEVVTDDLMSLFDLLNDIDVGMTECSIDDSYSRLEYGRRMFNAGLILYRRNDLTWAWLQEWAELSERNFRWASAPRLPQLAVLRHLSDEHIKRKLMCMDQISLVEMLSPETNKVNLKLKILDGSWLYRGSQMQEQTPATPKILHFPQVVAHQERLENAIHRALARMS